VTVRLDFGNFGVDVDVHYDVLSRTFVGVAPVASLEQPVLEVRAPTLEEVLERLSVKLRASWRAERSL
jgi:hypothetical protein